MAWLTPQQPATADHFCRRITYPADREWAQILSGALLELTYERNWEQFGAVTPEDAAATARDIFYAWSHAPEVCMIGMIVPFISSAPPAGTLECDGSVYATADYPQLAAALDPAFRVDALTFRVPDLRGRTVLGAGAPSGVVAAVGDTGGAAAITLTVDQLPAHSHSADPHTHTAPDHAHTSPAHSHTSPPHAHQIFPPIPNLDIEFVDGAPDIAAGISILPSDTGYTAATIDPTAVTINPAAVAIDAATVTINPAGSGQPVDVLPPFVALRYAVIAS